MNTRTKIRFARQVSAYIWRHPANRDNRVRAILRSVIFQIRGRFGLNTKARIGSMSILAILHHTASSKVVYANPPDYNEMIAWRKILREGDLFLDIGANVGTYSLWAADCGATVMAFEPGRIASELLSENVNMNDSRRISVDVHSVAVGATEGSMTLTDGLDTMNRLVLGGSGNEVPVTTLDAVLGERRARGAKVDVEGAERLVLEGAAASLRREQIDVLQLEWNDSCEATLGEDRSPVLRLLRGYGYELYRPDPHGNLVPVHDFGYGDDIFALSATAAPALRSDRRR